ncbi:hypothetical protein [Roseomonas sp. HF4]|uniref:hypothetical protein n=1 Tax=Roseomonas sp. HF4 TaxID=2562313 RepID=UPI0010C0C882|nr:hypothetical protein [Roseomonas sp. HF4]
MTPQRLASLIAFALAAVPAAASEYTRFESLQVTHSVQGDEGPACTRLALLNLPAGWSSGDAAVVLLTMAQTAAPLRDQLVSMLIEENTAVVELTSGGPASCAGDTAGTSRLAPPPDVAGELLGALDAVTRVGGAGLVVAIGYGSGAHQVLAATTEREASVRLGPDGPRFAATLALGDGTPRFALGATQVPRERASERLALLCGSLGHVADGLREDGRAELRAASAACNATLAVAANPTAVTVSFVPPRR